MSKECPVPLLDMLSKPLQEELQLQRHSQCLRGSAFFQMLLDEEDQATNRVVCEIVTGMQHSILGLDDTIFSAWEVATMCFYVAEGGCFYRRESAAPLRQLSNIWVAEAGP